MSEEPWRKGNSSAGHAVLGQRVQQLALLVRQVGQQGVGQQVDDVPQPVERPGLDVTGFDGVLSVDVEARTADVLGMTTYEHLVDATLPYGFMPLVVPELKTITLGGAVPPHSRRMN